MKYSSTLLTMPRPVSPKRKRMPAENRAAQFAPFAALTGYDGEIREVCRFTEACPFPAEDLQAELERKLNVLRMAEELHPSVEILYFLPDCRKEGGTFLTACGKVICVDPETSHLLLDSGLQIPLGRICNIESPLFSEQEL